jgi:hypothetical protein
MSTAAAADGAAPAKAGKKKLIIALALLLLLAAVAGGGMLWWLKARSQAAHADDDAAAELSADGAAAPQRRDPKAVPVFIALDNFTVNLADRDAERYEPADPVARRSRCTAARHHRREPEARAGGGAEQGGIRDYDLASQERIVRGRMPTMEVINERFARNIRVGLFNLIRKSPEVVDRRHQGAEVQRLPARDRGADQLQHRQRQAAARLGLIVCDPSLVFAVIDALFGGMGKFHTRIEGRDFSPTEQRVILRLVETIWPSTARPGRASTRWSWSTSARRCSRSSPTSPRPARSWSATASRWRSARPPARSTSAFPTRRWSRSATCCTDHPGRLPAEPDRRWVNLLKTADPVRRGRTGGRTGHRAGHGGAAAVLQAGRLHRARPGAR